LAKFRCAIAEKILVKVEALNAAAVSGFSWDTETSKWVAGLSSVLGRQIGRGKSIPDRPERHSSGLGEFLTTYIERRKDVKPNTRRNLLACRARLVEFFGQGKALHGITADDSDSFLLFLRGKGYANGTSRRTVKRAKQFFRVAVRQKLITENPLLT